MSDTAPRLLSSNATLFWRVFAPAFSVVFLGGIVVAHWATPAEDLYPRKAPVAEIRIGLTLLWILLLLLIYFTVWRIRRVESDGRFVYVSNYWVTARYPNEDVSHVFLGKKWGRRIARMYLKAPGRFGQVIRFLPGRQAKELLLELGFKVEAAESK